MTSTTAADLQAAFDYLKKCISVERESVWQLAKSDPIAALLLDLENSENIALLLGTLENVGDVKASLVSTKDMALLSSAFQFFILTCISPYLDKGVGVPLNLRSHLIQSWEQCSGDLEFRSSELFRAAECIVELLNCNEAVQGELLTKYSPDIFCVFEQLAYFGRNDFTEEFEKILSSMHPHLLVSTLLGLVKPRTGAQPTPSWFSFSIGSRLSAVLLGKNGLEITLSSYESISGEQMWQNTHLLFVLGKQFALPPRKMKKKSALAYGVLIDDVLFRPWELLNQSSNPCWTENHTTSLCLMKLWSNEKLGTEVLKDNPRFTSIAPVLLSLLPIPVMSTTSEVRNLKKDIYDVLKFSLEKIENLSMDQLIATRLCTEIACKCVKMWDDCVECNLSPRFVNTRSNNESDIEFARLSSHLVAGVFFEQIIDGDNTFSDPSVIVSLLDLVQSVLQSTVRYLRKRYQNNLFDVTVPAALSEVQNALITFVDCVHELCNDNADFTATAEDAHQLCSIFGKEASAKPSVVAHVEQNLPWKEHREVSGRGASITNVLRFFLECSIFQIFYAVKSIIGSDPSPLVRRSAVNLIRQVIKSCDTALVEVIGGRLRDLHGELLRLWRWDPDHVVRLHAELAIEELRAVMKSMILEETKCPRQIVL
ncbi:unnamed protein product [Nippostrongylus brasiliensis]|uniref:LOW QUALITY PROTEIN: thyroid adenoma-associated protein homolog n=1 Tax=Nippostrongylus brasiliensis TaxID=27835 RepID=A0A0N4XVR0_NIPBR|nr:unnamed protein product [Nippostrongylus brasiliensis]